MAIDHPLKEKLRQAAVNGTVHISSDDLATKPVTPALTAPEGPVTARVPVEATRDPLINAGATNNAGTALADVADATAPAVTGNLVSEDMTGLLNAEIKIDPEDKEAFLDALVSNKRYVRSFSVFGDRLTGTFRSRAAAESQAIATWLNVCLKEKRWESELDYSLTIRNIMLTAQVATFRGTAYPELAQPLLRVKNGATTAEPAWVDQIVAWTTELEPVLSAVYEELRLFERKYWTMIKHAADQDFWPPVASI